jgi:hypothetical protein
MYADDLRHSVSMIMSRPPDDELCNTFDGISTGVLRVSASLVISGEELSEFHRRLTILEGAIEQRRILREQERARAAERHRGRTHA